MAILHVGDIDDRLYDFLKASARLHNRSVSQEVVTIIHDHLHSGPHSNATLEFLALSGAWKDERDAEEIIDDIRRSRTVSTAESLRPQQRRLH